MTDKQTTELLNYDKLSLSIRCLTIYHEVTALPAVKKLITLFDYMTDPGDQLIESTTALAAVYRTLMADTTGCTWAELIINAILHDDNPFSRRSASIRTSYDREKVQELAPAVLEDLSTLQKIARLNAAQIKEDLRQVAISSGQEWALAIIGKLPEWPIEPPQPSTRKRREPNSPSELIAQFLAKLHVDGGWPDLFNKLMQFHKKNGVGFLPFHHVFRWQDKELQIVLHPDDIALADLVDYHGVIKQAVHNTKLFLDHRFAENILFYGARGTGKSSTVKAIANEFASKGLRLIELTKQHIGTLPLLLEELAHLSQYFIIFIDDLSFDAVDDDFNTLKSIVQGGSTHQPDNILIYVTTNRRHLVVERFTDTQDDMFEVDARQERLSLSERFGLTLNFRTPIQKTYLDIVFQLAVQHGMDPSDPDLADKALTFATRQSSRSPRTAQQFIRQYERDHSK
ncbi:MAG: ATP-binding protein [Fastidiosipilaceae bacterium]|nr:DUF815 domain-containing protein [Clostridiaceae bacterium]